MRGIQRATRILGVLASLAMLVGCSHVTNSKLCQCKRRGRHGRVRLRPESENQLPIRTQGR